MSEWISVNDRLPQSYSDKLLRFVNGAYAVGYLEPYRFFGLRWRWRWGGRKTNFENVTHWMLLPSPPSADKEQR